MEVIEVENSKFKAKATVDICGDDVDIEVTSVERKTGDIVFRDDVEELVMAELEARNA